MRALVAFIALAICVLAQVEFAVVQAALAGEDTYSGIQVSTQASALACQQLCAAEAAVGTSSPCVLYLFELDGSNTCYTASAITNAQLGTLSDPPVSGDYEFGAVIQDASGNPVTSVLPANYQNGQPIHYTTEPTITTPSGMRKPRRREVRRQQLQRRVRAELSRVTH